MRDTTAGTRPNRTFGIILAVCMIVLGIFLAIWPLRTGFVIMVIASIGFIVFGAFQIIGYARTPREYKNGWRLANGIIYVVLGFLLLSEPGASMYLTYAFLLGFIAMYTGIMQCAEFFTLKGVPGAGWALLSGIINIILSIFLIVTPFAATWAMEYVLGIYLIVGGVALLFETRSGHYGATS